MSLNARLKIDPRALDASDGELTSTLPSRAAAGTRFLRLMTVFFIVTGRAWPWSLK